MSMRKRGIAVCVAATMMLSLCACGGEPTVTTAVGDATTTTVADEVTTTVADEATTTVADEMTTIVTGEMTTVGDKTTAAGGRPTTTKDAVTTADPWGKATKPAKVTTTTKAKETTTTGHNNTLAPINRDPKYANDYGIYHTLKGYCWGTVIKASEWLPVVGYMKDGQVVDAMYTSTTIMPSPQNVYYRNFFTKVEWDEWRAHTYQNLDELNAAAKTVQDRLQLKEHKVKVFLTLVTPNPDIHKQWGTLNGTMMKAANYEQRSAMIKYMIDSYVTEMKTKNYSNIEFAGFYWFDEYIIEGDMKWYREITDYVRSKGLITMISPYYKARGWNLWKKAGFDLHSMQSNYFPERRVGEMNAGSEKRLDANAATVNKGESGGIEMESNFVKKDCYTALKMTMKVGIETGIVNGYHVHYFGGGPRSLAALYKSRDAYEHSCYDELYKYMHNTLTVDELWIDPLEDEQGILPGFTEDL